MTETLTRSREWLLLNAVESWLYHYESVGTPATIEQYKQMRDEFHDAYMQTLHKDAPEPTLVEPEPKPTTRRSNAKANTTK